MGGTQHWAKKNKKPVVSATGVQNMAPATVVGMQISARIHGNQGCALDISVGKLSYIDRPVPRLDVDTDQVGSSTAEV
jgi:hypothetical protein